MSFEGFPQNAIYTDIFTLSLPLLQDSYPDGVWRLRGYLARANPHSQSLARNGVCLAMFQGESGYISPGWYAARAENGKVVPTCN